MPPSQPLVRLAIRSLPCRVQCRFVSTAPRPATVRESAAGGLVNDLLRNNESQRQRPTSFARQEPRTPSSDGSSQAAGVPRERARFLAIAESRTRAKQAEQEEAMRQPYTREDLERQGFRRWQVGDVYAPHDLTGVEMAKWKKLRTRKASGPDVFDQLGINPMREYKNFSMMAEFVSETGRIKPRKETGLRPVNQRRIARAIRRAVGVGLMPRTYMHPELMKRENKRLPVRDAKKRGR